MPTRCDEHADRLLSIEHFLRGLKRSGNATLVAVLGVLGAVIAAAVAGWFQLEAARADIRTDCVACPRLPGTVLSAR
jgi:hypothetical protein